MGQDLRTTSDRERPDALAWIDPREANVALPGGIDGDGAGRRTTDRSHVGHAEAAS